MIVNAKRKGLLIQAKKTAKAAAFGHSTKELSGILIETDGRAGVIRMTATNHEVAIRATLPAAVERDGNTVIDARLFQGILERLPGEEVYMELKENGELYFRGGISQYTVSVMDSKKYPKVEIPFPANTVSIKGLKSLITRSSFAAAADNIKPVLSCVNLIFSDKGIHAISCDGICAVQATGDPECKGNISLLVPAASLRMLAALAEDGDVYELGVTGSGGAAKNVVFSDGMTMFSARLVEGRYLDTDMLFRSVVPIGAARVEADKLFRVLEHVSSVAAAGDKVEFSFGDAGLILKCENDSGNVTAALAADVVSGTEEKYYYTLKKLLNCVKVLKGGVMLNFSENKMLEIVDDNMKFIQVGVRPEIKKKSKNETHKNAA